MLEWATMPCDVGITCQSTKHPQRSTAMRVDSIEKLFVEELKDLYSAENQITKALPRMANAATSRDLKKVFESH